MVKIRENPIKIDDLGIPLFLETPISPEEKAFRGSFHTDPHQVFEGFWMSRV